MKKTLLLILACVLMFSCKKQVTEAVSQQGEQSIFLLNSQWENQDGKKLQLQKLKGKNIVMVMIFTSCKTACPLLVADMQKIAAKIDPKKMKETTMVFVSIDPDNDTPEVLKAYAEQHHLTGSEWLFLRSDKESVRELANVLAVKYKKISPIVFSHSNIITVFNKNGEMVKQSEGTVNAEEVAAVVNALQ